MQDRVNDRILIHCPCTEPIPYKNDGSKPYMPYQAVPQLTAHRRR